MTLDHLLERSELFKAKAVACFPATGVVLAVSDVKNELVAAACSLCIEHSDVIRAALSVDAPNSASAVLRLQYEALLRGVWLMFVANAVQVEKLAKSLDQDAEEGAKKVGGYSEMLNATVKAAPEALSAPLAEFDRYSRHALNSFVHSGIHALHRTRHGFPPEMGETVIRFSNALTHFSYRLLADLSGSRRRMDRITRLHLEFSACLPGRPA